MSYRAGKPKHVSFSESLDRLIRTRRNFAVRPFGFDNKKWEKHLLSSNVAPRQKETQEEKKMIRETAQGVKGLDFPAEEMAKIIRSWIARDE
ncbi:MAG: hypothetical protein AB1742_00660 [bacterium]